MPERLMHPILKKADLLKRQQTVEQRREIIMKAFIMDEDRKLKVVDRPEPERGADNYYR